MSRHFVLSKFDKPSPKQASRLELQLKRLKSSGHSTDAIEQAVDDATTNLEEGARSFVIYGEPQSGKTEMMICLTAKLLDDGHDFVLHLLNDSVDLLGQNLSRFKESGLTPGARNFSEILDPAVKIKGHQHVVFCKKNGSDLRNLIDKIGTIKNIVVIDDEADFASPNSKINQGKATPINALIAEIIGTHGIYIGVTATPARLDLNNTFNNDNERWVVFRPHPNYTGQDVFFPIKGAVRYRRTFLNDHGADPKHARDALFRFLVTSAHLNLNVHPEQAKNYSFLVHTSGKKADHRSDWSTIYGALDVLSSRTNAEKFSKYVRRIWSAAESLYPSEDPDEITHYVLDNVGNYSIVILNSERDWQDNSAAATNPNSIFTIIIGGNIVSRGVTLKNLLAMFFTRDVKHKIQQDTYIQRARMFGSRDEYLNHFELTIPSNLYVDWHRCFVFHRLSLTAICENKGSPVWIGDARIAPVSSASIDRSTVDLNRGEMSFPLFKIDCAAISTILSKKISNIDKMRALAAHIGEPGFPSFLVQFVESTANGDDQCVAIHSTADVSGYKPDANTSPDTITRKKGFFGTNQKDAANGSTAVHHLKVFRNDKTGMARLFYKFEGSVHFIKNEK